MDAPWLLPVPDWYEQLPTGYVVVHQDDDRLYWTGEPSAPWSRRAPEALVDEVAPWHPGRNPVPIEGRCVLVVTDGTRMLPIYKWHRTDCAPAAPPRP